MTEADEVGGFPPSQASSHFAIEPVSAAVLAGRERARRDGLRRRGAVATGCREIDEGALLGGLERGSVAGLSAEGEGFGTQVAFQAVARNLADGGERAMVVTTLTAGAVLPGLRDALRARLAEMGREGEGLKGAVRDCLGRVSVATVFDLEGVWEVLGELDVEDDGGGEAVADGERESTVRDGHEDVEPDTDEKDGPERGDGTTAPETAGESMTPPPAAQGSHSNGKTVLPELKPGKAEIADSEDEEGLSSLSSSPLSSPPASSLGSVPPGLELNDDRRDTGAARVDSPAESSESPSQEPVLVEEASTMDGTSDHSDVKTPEDIDGLPRKPPATVTAEPPLAAGEHPSTAPTPARPTSTTPDIILITHFSTLLTTLFTRQERSSAHTAIQLLASHLRYLSRALPSSPLIMLLNSTAPSSSDAPAQAADTPSRKPSARPLNATLRSIFNPPQLPMAGYHNPASRRNKPSFGMVFSQMLDVHLLCTRVPRDVEDAERVFGDAPGEARFVWVVEVLLDEIGVWGDGRGPRRSREQRWGAVDVVKGRVVDAFELKGPRVHKEIRLAAGFGGLRV